MSSLFLSFVFFPLCCKESNAEKALEALKELQPLQARVLRSGIWRILPSADLVPGDVVDVRCGDKIPADCRLVHLKSTTLRVEQSQLTGESVTVTKVKIHPKKKEEEEKDRRLSWYSFLSFKACIHFTPSARLAIHPQAAPPLHTHMSLSLSLYVHVSLSLYMFMSLSLYI